MYLMSYNETTLRKELENSNEGIFVERLCMLNNYDKYLNYEQIKSKKCSAIATLMSGGWYKTKAIKLNDKRIELGLTLDTPIYLFTKRKLTYQEQKELANDIAVSQLKAKLLKYGKRRIAKEN